jgi:hypothetical protein
VILLLNGAFGIGKTTVAREIRRMRPGTLLFDPELIGGPLQLAARLAGRGVDDFQDLAIWRRLTIAGLRSASRVRPRIVVPMTFSNLAYLREVREGLAAGGRDVRHVCLVAPLAVVQERLRRRGSDATRSAWSWRRAAECCAAHADPAFAVHVDASARTPSEIAPEILAGA